MTPDAEAATNLLTHAPLDPVAEIPEYKLCAVAIEAANVANGPCRRSAPLCPLTMLSLPG